MIVQLSSQIVLATQRRFLVLPLINYLKQPAIPVAALSTEPSTARCQQDDSEEDKKQTSGISQMSGHVVANCRAENVTRVAIVENARLVILRTYMSDTVSVQLFADLRLEERLARVVIS